MICLAFLFVAFTYAVDDACYCETDDDLPIEELVRTHLKLVKLMFAKLRENRLT